MFTYENKPTRSARNARRRGAVIVEMAIAVPLLAFFLFAIIQWAMVMNTLGLMSNVARDTARFAAVHGTESTADDKTDQNSIYSYGNQVAASVGLSNAVIDIGTVDNKGAFVLDENHDANNPRPPGAAISIRVSYNMSTRIPLTTFIPGILQGNQQRFATFYLEPQ